MAPHAHPVPPGWYSDGTLLRWWDGAAWGPTAPPPPQPLDNQKAMAALAHIGAFVGGFIVPLVLFLVNKDRQSLSRQHAVEALNFQLTLMVAQIGAILLAFVGFALQIATAADGALDDESFIPWALVALVPALLVMAGANIVFSIIGIVKATQLERWRYPVSIRFLR